MTKDEIIRMAREAQIIEPSDPDDGDFVVETVEILTTFADSVAASAAAAERERICKAIKDEDDYCVTEGDYMLDSDDCIAVAKGEWVRPGYSVSTSQARSQS